MQKAIENCFPQILNGDCLAVDKRSKFHIYDSNDDPRRCFVSQNETDEIHFTAINANNKNVQFLAIDKCIFDDQGPSRCDFALFTDLDFCFVEIKDVKMRGRQKARIRAKNQLLNTIEEFIQRGVGFDTVDLNAIICFVERDLYPSRSAQYNDTILEFEERFGSKFLITNNFAF